ncbi:MULTISPECIES: SCO family protein [unclassified Bacillus (in: firmicutes)]|uniref:SCO family protein n=1 Tax=unclassified Bacillus (in: firmicutes) TaxID=185979 RepID=UPI0008E08AC3|nr:MULTISPECIES: SCO family protein [unclassified Bacillus (in: firmicutes)]SFI00973.1 protein SCO1/2 [Bacillus sp. 71mf]SFS92574.1 protein SCO1/2 [Bacillus sp. 103mf]
MKRYQKWIGILAAFCLLLLAGCSSGSKLRDPLNWDVESFQYINQNGEKFGTKDLKGKVWVADLVFTSCQTVCPPMTANMAKLQRLAKEEKLDVQFVSFSVDPEVDKPEKLKAFVQKFTDDTKNWNLLTGYSQDDIEKFAKNNFKTLVDKPDNQDQVLHGTKFYLVDQNGKVMKEYSGMNNTPYDDILRDIRRLTR